MAVQKTGGVTIAPGTPAQSLEKAASQGKADQLSGKGGGQSPAVISENPQVTTKAQDTLRLSPDAKALNLESSNKADQGKLATQATNEITADKQVLGGPQGITGSADNGESVSSSEKTGQRTLVNESIIAFKQPEGTKNTSDGNSTPGSWGDKLKAGRRRYGYDDDTEEQEDEEFTRGKKKRQYITTTTLGGRRKIETTEEESQVMEGQTADIFSASSITDRNYKIQKIDRHRSTLRQQIEDYKLGATAEGFYNIIKDNIDSDKENGVGENLQSEFLNKVVECMIKVRSVNLPEYRHLVRGIVQGTLQAALKEGLRIQEAVKMVATGIFAVSPHKNKLEDMEKAIHIIAAEIILGQINIGYSMRLVSYALGGAMFMIYQYYKHYPPDDFTFDESVEQSLKYACNDGIWEGTLEVTGYSETHARDNTHRFVEGYIQEEKLLRDGIIKSMFMLPLEPIKKLGEQLRSIPIIKGIRTFFTKFKSRKWA